MSRRGPGTEQHPRPAAFAQSTSPPRQSRIRQSRGTPPPPSVVESFGYSGSYGAFQWTVTAAPARPAPRIGAIVATGFGLFSYRTWRPPVAAFTMAPTA